MNNKFTFNNLVLNENLVNKLENFFCDNTIPININIIGKKGHGKKTVLNCILNKCFSISLNDFTLVHNSNYIYNYDDILYIPIYNLNSSDINEIMIYIKKFSKYKSLFNKNKIIIFDNVNKTNNLFKTFINTYCESNKIKFITTSSSNDHKLKKYYTTCMNFKIPYLNQNEFFNFIKKKKIKINKKIKLKLFYSYKNNNYDLKFINYLLDNHQEQCLEEIIDSKSSNLKLADNLLSKFNIVLLNICLNYSPENLEKIRQKLYLIHSLSIPCKDIISNNLSLLLKNKNITLENKFKCIEIAGETNRLLINCDREIFYLENYFFKISKILNNL